MALPSSWVDKLFGKLTVAYGQRFLGLYSGIDLADVKAEWADTLDGLDRRPEAIKHALEHLNPDSPPTAMQFRAMCRNAPTMAPKALPMAQGKPDAAVLAKVAEALKPSAAVDQKDWAWKLARKELWQQQNSLQVMPRDALTHAQRTMWREALGFDLSVKVAEVLPEETTQ